MDKKKKTSRKVGFFYDRLYDFERKMIQRAFKKSKFCVTTTAEKLNLERTTLVMKMKKLGVSAEEK